MKAIFGTFAIFVTAQAILAGFGIGEGFLIHLAIPAVDLNVAIFVGVAAAITMAHFMVQVLNAVASRRLDEDASENREDDEAPPTFYVPVPPMHRQRPRRKKK
ncbi:MAG TPA: hypothetical protein VGY55_00925 [Pirellulales bacterium]|jgi:hypothetical protein|nr:hypothetical protein [Pirellulales bacterium]